MELKQGYKQTELGIIPKEWEVKSIDQIFSFYSTSNYSKAQMTLEGEVGCLHYGLIHAIKNSSFNVKSGIKYYVEKKQAKYEFVVDGDIVMVDASEDLSGVNKSVEISGIGTKLYISGLHTFLLRDRGFLAEYFRGAILNSNITKTQMLRLAVGMKVYGVSKPQLKTVLLPVPPLHEQTAIANALSDMDALISQTEKLIDKKKAIKQGAMQELLKPKDEWVTKKLGDICEMFSGGTPSTENASYYGGNINWIVSGDLNKFIIDEVDGKITELGLSNSSAKLIEPETILLAMYGATAGVSAISKIQGAINQAILAIIPHKDYSIEFLFYSLTLYKDWIIKTYTQGGQPNLSGSIIKSIELSFPKIEDQTRISNILSDLILEITKFETKLNKLKQQKQGMMQALLTGKIRLVS